MPAQGGTPRVGRCSAPQVPPDPAPSTGPAPSVWPRPLPADQVLPGVPARARLLSPGGLRAAGGSRKRTIADGVGSG